MPKLNKHEIALIVISLILTAVLVLYNIISVSNLSRITVNESSAANVIVSSESVSYTSGALSECSSDATEEASADNRSDSRYDETQSDLKDEYVNINTADSDELQKLPGIGSVKAEAIIEYRIENGSFRSVDDLINVKGIGEKTLEKLKPYAAV